MITRLEHQFAQVLFGEHVMMFDVVTGAFIGPVHFLKAFQVLTDSSIPRPLLFTNPKFFDTRHYCKHG